MSAKLEGLRPEDTGRWGILEFDTGMVVHSLDGLLVGRTLIDLGQASVPVRLMNLTDEQRQIRQGTALASCEVVESVLHPDDLPKTVPVPGSVRLPQHVNELYQRNVTGLCLVEQQQVFGLLQEFADVFSQGPHDLGRTDVVKHQIDIGDAVPVRQPPHRLPLVKREEAQRQVESMRRQGVIEPSTSPWASPIVLVKKKNGETRFCVDYRKLNQVTRKDSYPLPRIEDTVEALAGAQLFSTLDLKSGYWHVELEAEAKEKTAFTTGRGLWQFHACMPFALCNAPATFERLMEQVLAGLPLSVCLVYLDDMPVPGRSFPEAIRNLREVFGRLRSARLKLSPGKCVLFRREVKYLGHIVSSDGVAMNEDKVDAIRDWPTPKSLTELRTFLGLCARTTAGSFHSLLKSPVPCMPSHTSHTNSTGHQKRKRPSSFSSKP